MAGSVNSFVNVAAEIPGPRFLGGPPRFTVFCASRASMLGGQAPPLYGQLVPGAWKCDFWASVFNPRASVCSTGATGVQDSQAEGCFAQAASVFRAPPQLKVFSTVSVSISTPSVLGGPPSVYLLLYRC